MMGYVDKFTDKFKKTDFYKSNKSDLNEFKDVWKQHTDHYAKYGKHYRRFFNIYFYCYVVSTIYRNRKEGNKLKSAIKEITQLTEE